jgi:hypothetical protein
LRNNKGISTTKQKISLRNRSKKSSFALSFLPGATNLVGGAWQGTGRDNYRFGHN